MRLPLLGLAIMVLICIGCGSEKESLMEHDHVEPDHWPSGIVDAADSIDERVAALQVAGNAGGTDERAVMMDELTDLVEWSPEIAADTDLPEEQWIPIYEVSETLRGHLIAGDADLKPVAVEFEKLTSLLRAAGEEVAKIEAARSEAASLGSMEIDLSQEQDSKETESGDEAAEPK